MPFPAADIHQQSRLVSCAVDDRGFDWIPINPIVTSSQGMAHESIEVFESAGHRTEELENRHLSVVSILHQTITWVGRALITSFGKVLRCLSGRASNQLAP